MTKKIATISALAATLAFSASASAAVGDSYMRRAIDAGQAVVAVSNETIVPCRPGPNIPVQSCLRAVYFFQAQPVNGHGTLTRCDVLSAPSSTGVSVIVEERCSQVL